MTSEEYNYGFAEEHPNKDQADEFFQGAATSLGKNAHDLKTEEVIVSGRKVCVYTLATMMEEEQQRLNIGCIWNQRLWHSVATRLGLKRQPLESDEARRN